MVNAKKELAQELKEASKDAFGRFDLRKVLSKYNTIEDLRIVVDTLVTEFSDEDLKHTWSLSDEMTTDDVNVVRDSMKYAVNEFYDILKNDYDVITVNESNKEASKHILKTYIINIKYLKKYYFKYIGYDFILKKYVSKYPDKLGGIKQTILDGCTDEKIKEVLDKGNDAILVRLLPPDNIGVDDEGSIQLFPINIADSIKANIYMPWGPYELSEFIVGKNSRNLINITTDKLDSKIKNFIKKYNLTSIL